ncbi:hypothetical protein DFR76_10990 [Nocardia pseudobrasiliensis]|uniref:Uncharacterized protein n=1 Tax=Nocardia pseudobrasiliensis TaxID=45979 RepID=A0A370HZ11_9NOCA|nr:hypothetical protein DFR76_10990 [Nocardia pseudobrasiliensis]
MVVLSAVISVLLIAAVSVACWWLVHTEEYADDLDLPHRVCARCLLDGIDRPIVEDLSARLTCCAHHSMPPEPPAAEPEPVESTPTTPVRDEVPAVWSWHPAQ